MRILCLHDRSSSAKHLHATLNCLEERLWTRHDIELVFVNAPLVYQSSVKSGGSDNDDDDDSQNLSLIHHIQELNITSPAKKKSCKTDIHKKNGRMITTNDDDDDDTTQTNVNKTRIREKTKMNENCRCWWEESINNIDDSGNKQQLIGLDASILQLQQLWSSLPPSSTTTDSPFVGILGIGQGAALASILSLISSSKMFDGLEFAIFIKGFDLLQQQQQQSSSSVWFEGEPPIHTLHVMSSQSSSSEHNLYDCFGGDLYPKRNHRYYLGSNNNNTNTSRTKNNRCKRRLTKVTTKHTINVQDLNIMGRYIVERKKEWQFHRQKLQSILIPTTTITNDVSLSYTEKSLQSKCHSSMEKENKIPLQHNHNKSWNEQDTKKHRTKIVSLEETKQKIDALERYALERVLPVAIKSNPPKSLIASIFRPTLKGAWMGGHKDVDRSKDFTESGGAPYPSSSTIIPPSVIKPQQEGISFNHDAVMKS